jgi:hypothetical protein
MLTIVIEISSVHLPSGTTIGDQRHLHVAGEMNDFLDERAADAEAPRLMLPTDKNLRDLMKMRKVDNRLRRILGVEYTSFDVQVTCVGQILFHCFIRLLPVAQCDGRVRTGSQSRG